MRRRDVLISLAAGLPLASRTQTLSAAPLVDAAAAGDLTRVRGLLEQGVPIEQRDAQQRTAVIAASDARHLQLAGFLIARGADVNAQDRQRDSAFLIACRNGDTELVRAALAAGADLKSTNRYGSTALMGACYRGHVETVRLLLATPIELEHVNNFGWTALLECVVLGQEGPAHQEILRLLIARGANVNVRDPEGVSALQHARRRGHEQVAQLLAAAGAR
jgi:uncharacterized protein